MPQESLAWIEQAIFASDDDLACDAAAALGRLGVPQDWTQRLEDFAATLPDNERRDALYMILPYPEGEESVPREQPGELLFDGRLSAFTKKITFIDRPLDEVMRGMNLGFSSISNQATGKQLFGDLEDLLSYLEPEPTNSTKTLIVEAGNGWSASFHYGDSGNSAFDVAARYLQCRSLHTGYSPHLRHHGEILGYGSCSFWLYDHARGEIGTRTLQASYQSRWDMHMSGTPQPFEEKERYQRKKVRERFDLEMLNRYCNALNIRRNDPTFYGPRAVLLMGDTSGWETRPRQVSSREWREEYSVAFDGMPPATSRKQSTQIPIPRIMVDTAHNQALDGTASNSPYAISASCSLLLDCGDYLRTLAFDRTDPPNVIMLVIDQRQRYRLTMQDGKEQYLLSPDTLTPLAETELFEGFKAYRHTRLLIGRRKHALEANSEDLDVRFHATIEVGIHEAAEPSPLAALQRLAEKNDVDAQFRLAVVYDCADVFPKDQAALSLDWYRRAAIQGHLDAQYMLGLMLLDGRRTERDIMQGEQWVRQAAKQGHVGAQYRLGVMHREGFGVPQDDVIATQWFRKAAEGKSLYAQHDLGFLYAKGRGVAQDDVQAFHWYSKAADGTVDDLHEARDPRILRVQDWHLARYGSGKPQDYRPYYKPPNTLAHRLHGRPQFIVACRYRDGLGVAKDLKQAVNWFQKAAKLGHAAAQYNLGLSYRDGNGINKDDQQAANWLRKAALQGQATAQSALSVMYAKGQGVAADDELAYFWCLLSAAQGNQVALNNRDKIGKRLGAEQRAHTQAAVLKWKPSQEPVSK